MKIWTLLGKHAFAELVTLSKTTSPANADSELGNVCSNVMRELNNSRRCVGNASKRGEGESGLFGDVQCA